MSDSVFAAGQHESVVAQLGLYVEVDGGTATARGEVHPEMCLPGTDRLRTSVLATWADVVTGFIAVQAMSPRIPLTLDLEVQVEQAPAAGSAVVCEAATLKVGRSVLVTEAAFRDVRTGAPLAAALASFIASPNPEHVFASEFPTVVDMSAPPRGPLAARAGCTVVAPGVAEIPHRPGNLNSSGAIQGGMVALVAEEAATSLLDTPAPLRSLSVRYLRPLSAGRARAVATAGAGGLAVVRISDAGTGKLGTIVTARA